MRQQNQTKAEINKSINVTIYLAVQKRMITYMSNCGTKVIVR